MSGAVRTEPNGKVVLAVEYGWADLLTIDLALEMFAKKHYAACPPGKPRGGEVADLIERTKAAFQTISEATR